MSAAATPASDGGISEAGWAVQSREDLDRAVEKGETEVVASLIKAHRCGGVEVWL
jgi:hypothetical protein